jgi:hypothetical protein
VSEILTAEQATPLAERIREAVLAYIARLPEVRTPRADADLRDLDRWLRALHRAHEGLREHGEVTPRSQRCAWCLRRAPCPDARRYTDAATDASDALRDLAALYGAEVLDA